jgi:hypothetical protein
LWDFSARGRRRGWCWVRRWSFIFVDGFFVWDGCSCTVVFSRRLCVGVRFYDFRFVGIGGFGSTVSGSGCLTSSDVFDGIVEICVFGNIFFYYRLDIFGSRDRACNFGSDISWPMEPELLLEIRILVAINMTIPSVW